jgi:hypothetical protein
MQKTAETSTYGSEHVTALTTDIAMKLRYNIQMMGFTLDDWKLANRQSVILNTTIPSSQLKKKVYRQSASVAMIGGSSKISSCRSYSVVVAAVIVIVEEMHA